MHDPTKVPENPQSQGETDSQAPINAASSAQPDSGDPSSEGDGDRAPSQV